MSFQPSRTENIKTIFHGNRFLIPKYQRKYSWRYEQRKALWDDIDENLDMNHFLGTLAFKKNRKLKDRINDVYEIIDGQQRITTLYILLQVLIEKLEDEEAKEDYHTLFIGEEDKPKLMPIGPDGEFLQQLIFHFNSISQGDIEVRSQRFMYDTKRDFQSLSKEFYQEDIQEWIEYITQKIDVLIFNVANDSQAVKMFTVINDRGLPLSYLDKSKSILMFYSTHSLDGKLNKFIHKQFGEIFDAFDRVLIFKEKLQIFRTLDEFDFEITFYGHHYYSAKRLFEDWDYQLGAESIFKQLKNKCEKLKFEPDKLKQFIQEYTEDFNSFALSYADLLKAVEHNEKYKEAFQFLEFTATLYPLIIRLFEQERLDALLDLLIITEVRVYKLKGTNPRRNMYRLASNIVQWEYSDDILEDELIGFVTNFMNDYLFKDFLSEEISQKGALVRFILYELNKTESDRTFSIHEYRDFQVEHVFSRSPTFKIKPYGFGSREHYDVAINKFGNLTLIEKSINKAVRNQAPDSKTKGYGKSKVKITQDLRGILKKFNKDELEKRTEAIKDFCLERFSIQLEA